MRVPAKYMATMKSGGQVEVYAIFNWSKALVGRHINLTKLYVGG